MRFFGKPAGIAAALALVGAGAVFATYPQSVRQPIEFNHKKHIEDVGVVCTDCHLYAESGIRATIPNVETCAICHSEALTEAPAESTLVEHILADEPIRWLKVNRVPDHVFFSHRRHTTVAEIECVACHGAVDQREKALGRPLIRISMGRCTSCHYERDVTNDCISCHR